MSMLDSFKRNYAKVFSLEEIVGSKTLQFLYYCVTLSFFVTFYSWISSSSVSISSYINGNYTCPPYFPSCGKFFFLQDLPYGYLNGYFYVALFLILGWGIISTLKKDWVTAHLMLLIAWIWKIIWIFFLTYGIAGNYDYYDLVLGFVLLFLSNKLYFSKLSFVFLYFLASTIKIDEGWIFGNYFKSLVTGAPIFPDSLIPIFTNIVIVMQIVAAWFLLSKNKVLQKLVFIYFLIFHIYSGFIVNYRYITISITALVIIFGNLSFLEKTKFEILRISKKTIFGYSFLVLLFFGQMIGIYIDGNQKKTLEGNYWGVFMFEASHQCISTLSVKKLNDLGEIEEYNSSSENHIANNRCDPYMYWYKIKLQCDRDKNIKEVVWTFDHSINGHPYERIVDTDNACDLTYKTFSHNDWIKIEGESTKLDIPVYKTGYLDYLNEKALGIPAQPYSNNLLLSIMTKLYWSIWILTLGFVLIEFIFKQFRK